MPTTWDPSSVASVTLSGGNLVATNTGTTSTNQGAKVSATGAPTTGKYYLECVFTTFLGGGGVRVGADLATDTYANASTTPTTGAMVLGESGNIWTGAGNSGFNIGTLASGSVIGIALDLTNRKLWLRLSPSGLWDGNVSHDPTNAVTGGGYTLAAGTIVPFATFGSGFTGTGVANNVITAKFAAPFTGAIPSGYGAYDAAAAAAAQARALVMA